VTVSHADWQRNGPSPFHYMHPIADRMFARITPNQQVLWIGEVVVKAV
jgi:hypothetical protein